MRSTQFLTPIIASVGLLTGYAAADTVQISASRDATIFESSTGDLASGAGSTLFVGKTSRTNEIRRSLLYFDVAAELPADATIDNVTLTLTITNVAPDGGQIQHSLHRAATDWTEGASSSGGGSGAPAVAGDATWLHSSYDTQFWSTPGGDFAASPSASALVGDVSGVQVSFASGGLVLDVQEWLDGTAGNFGWFLLGGESIAGTARGFGSRESFNPDNAPKLIVEYTPIPAPASLLPIVAGSAVMMRRRR